MREYWFDGQNEHVDIFQVMIESGIGRCTIIAPDGDPQSPGVNDLKRVIEPDHDVRRTSFYMDICGGTIRLISRSGFTFVLVGEARDFDIAELKLSNQTVLWGALQHRGRNEREWRELYRPEWRKLVQEPL